MPEKSLFSIEAIIKRETLKPMILFSFGDKSFQCTPDKAIEHAMEIIKISEAAKADRFIVRFCLEKIGMKMQDIIAVLKEFRKLRSDNDEKPPDSLNGAGPM